MIDPWDIEGWFAINGKARIILDAEFAPNKYTVTVESLNFQDKTWSTLRSASGESLEEALHNLNHRE